MKCNEVELPTSESTRRTMREWAKSPKARRLVVEIETQEAHDTLVDLLTAAYENGYRDGWMDRQCEVDDAKGSIHRVLDEALNSGDGSYKP